jgi:hypothetical protein
MELIKIFKPELLKLAVFMFCFSLSIAYLMFETHTGVNNLFNFLIRIIIF